MGVVIEVEATNGEEFIEMALRRVRSLSCRVRKKKRS